MPFFICNLFPHSFTKYKSVCHVQWTIRNLENTISVQSCFFVKIMLTNVNNWSHANSSDNEIYFNWLLTLITDKQEKEVCSWKVTFKTFLMNLNICYKIPEYLTKSGYRNTRYNFPWTCWKILQKDLWSKLLLNECVT